MSDTYTKLFRSITASTIVSEPVATRWLWVTMLALADSRGCVWGSVPGLARLANISLPECEAALECFHSPDPHSRTKAHDGRRVEAIDGGWRLINHAKYGAIRNEAERAEYKRQWDRKNRPSGHARQSDSSPAARQESDSSPTVQEFDSPTTVRQSDNSPTIPTIPTAPTPPTPTPTSVEAKAKAVHLPMHAVTGKGHHHDDRKPSAKVNGQSTFAKAVAPNGTDADSWAAWVEHVVESFRGSDEGLRRKLLAEARYLETCNDPAAVIDAAIADGDDCLPNDWMDEPAGRTHRGAGGESATMTALKAMGALDGRIPVEAVADDFPGVPPVPELSRDCGTADDAAAYRRAKDGE